MEAENLISEEKSGFGRDLLKAVLSLIYEICSFNRTIVTASDLRGIAARPTSLYFQDKERITTGVLKKRLRQVCIVSVVGVCSENEYW